MAAFTPRALARVFDRGTPALRRRLVTIYAVLGAMNLGALLLAFAAFASRPLLLGTALLAYTFGLRHAVDADHISAIDNVTRKLMQEDKRPVAVGFFFSLGHSTIVVALTVAIAVASIAVKSALPGLENAGGLIGTSVSAVFLFAVAAINVMIFLEVARAFTRVRRGEPYDERNVEGFLNQRGLLGRIFRPLFKSIGESWHMYPLGVLFGLGFDTATEVGLLGIAAVEGGKGLPIYDILIFPLLFTAGMSLLDTSDGVLMLGAYGWAFVKPVRKLYYNMVMTLVSVIVAVVVGAIEVLGLLATQLHLSGPLWDLFGSIGDHFGELGFGIIALFIATWLISALVYRASRFDDLGEPAPAAVAIVTN